MSPKPGQTITKHFASLPDPRAGNATQHLLGDILVIAICAGICGADGWVEVEAWGNAKRPWLEQFLELPNGIPPWCFRMGLRPLVSQRVRELLSALDSRRRQAHSAPNRIDWWQKAAFLPRPHVRLLELTSRYEVKLKVKEWVEAESRRAASSKGRSSLRYACIGAGSR